MKIKNKKQEKEVKKNKKEIDEKGQIKQNKNDRIYI